MPHRRRHGPLGYTDIELAYFDSLNRPQAPVPGIPTAPPPAPVLELNEADLKILEKASRDRYVQNTLRRNTGLWGSILGRTHTFFDKDGDLSMAWDDIWNCVAKGDSRQYETVSLVENLKRFKSFYQQFWEMKLEQCVNKEVEHRISDHCRHRLLLLQQDRMVVPVNWRGGRPMVYCFNKKGRALSLREVSVREAHRRLMKYVLGVKSFGWMSPRFEDAIHRRSIDEMPIRYVVAFFVSVPFGMEPNP